MPDHLKSRGQTLVLFALFLTVLLGASAIAIDYANWLLTDRALQNIADHAALAGASVFGQDVNQFNCSVNLTNCVNARTQAWTSLNQELSLGLTTADISTLAATDTPAAGQTTKPGGATFAGNHTIWVTTPPQSYAAYTAPGGRYAANAGVVWVRLDRPTRSYFGAIFGISVRPRIGWATAGIIPTDFALEVFCRNNIQPQNGVCAGNGTGLVIDGGGGITLNTGDVGSNESLKVSQQTGQGVIVKSGNVFLVEGTCGPSTWVCPPTALGGISDGNGNAKNAFFIPPNPVPIYALPAITGTPFQGTVNTVCSAISACIPGSGANNATPIDWSCVIGTGSGSCGTPTVTTTNGVSSVSCASNSVSTRDLRPSADTTISPNNSWSAGGPGRVNGSGNVYKNINETTVDPSGTALPAPPSGPTTLPAPTATNPNNWAYSNNLGVGGSALYRVSLSSPNGLPQAPGFYYVRYVLFKTNNGTIDGTQNPVQVTAQLQERVGASWVNRGASDTETATGTMTAYQVPAVDVTQVTDPNALSILFTATTPSGSNTIANKRGAGISWAEAYLDKDPVPPPPPMIPAGLYRSVVIPDNGCAILDPTAYYGGGLKQYQMPGVYYFEDHSGGGQNATISLGSGSFLIGDGVSLIFDSNWPNPGGSGGSASAHGIEINANGALVLNSSIAGGYNPSSPLSNLPVDSVGAAWAINPASPSAGASAWGGACPNVAPCVAARSSYAPTSGYRGVTFYFRPKTNSSTNPANYSILGRFSLGGTSAGISFRGIMYAPFDDVDISGSNGFDTVGMVLAWTAKFNGGSASINLDYPYARVNAPPYLLEPTVTH